MTFLLSSYLTASSGQIDRLSNIFDNAGQVALGALVFSQVTGGFDNTRTLVLVYGVAIVLLCWMTSLWLSKKRKDFNEI